MDLTQITQTFLNTVKQKYDNSPNILKAYQFAKDAHEGQLRASGEPYIIHPLHVAYILTDLNMDEETIIAALLHDTVEDAGVHYETIRREFGTTVEELVKGVTNIPNFKKYESREQKDIESLRRLMLSMTKDIRVILIKLADRLHNMRTLNYLPEIKQKRIAKETQDIFVPLCERLGLCEFRGEMDDLCLKYLKPKEYSELEQRLLNKFAQRQQLVEDLKKQLEQVCIDLNINAEVYGRFKHFSSIYKKLQNKGVEKIYDIIAHRVIVDEVKDCYTVLGEIHHRWKPVYGRFKDYIASPKVNGYQSLHTTLLTADGVPFEVQIRTKEMHKICEYGVAAHWRYKGDTSIQRDIDDKLNSIKTMVESNTVFKDSENFIKALKMDLDTNEIWVFTPKRKVVELPKNSTPVDFAYAVHTGLGHRCIGAKVNDKMMPLSTILETGDIVEIITSQQDKGPSRDWLNFVRCSSTKQRIRQYFKREMKDENIKRGKQMLELEAKNRNVDINKLFVDEYIKVLTKAYNLTSLDDLYASVGCGGLTTNQVIGRIIAEKKNKEKHDLSADKIAERINQRTDPQKTASNKGVLVFGRDDVMVRLGKCCNPIPGDDIVAFSVGKGITVHRSNCKCIKDIDPARAVEVQWIDNGDSAYEIALDIVVEDKADVLNKIINLFALSGIYISQFNAKSQNSGTGNISIRAKVKNQTQAQDIINKLSSLSFVIDVNRK